MTASQRTSQGQNDSTAKLTAKSLVEGSTAILVVNHKKKLVKNHKECGEGQAQRPTNNLLLI